MIRVLVVDDSVTIRGMVSTLLSEDSEIQVIGVAANGKLALAKYAQLRPDVMTLDVEMPEMDGLTTLKALRREDPKAAVIMFSSLTHRGATTTFDALAAGAMDYVAKPDGANANDLIRGLGADLIAKVKLAAANKNRASGIGTPASVPSPKATLPTAAPSKRGEPPSILAIASSTGGPNALSALIPAFPKDFGIPIVIAQHMPEIFTKLLADRLKTMSKLDVREGSDGEAVEAGVVYIAPGGRHMETVKSGSNVRIRLHNGPPENSCRPAADVLFRSVASVYGTRALAIVLTGMGQDGLSGSQVIHDAEGTVLAQDEASSVVWGMPRVVAERGLAQAILPLNSIAQDILRRVHVHA